MSADVISLDDHRLVYEMIGTLRFSASPCGKCSQPWHYHTTAQIVDHCMELQRRKAAELAAAAKSRPLVATRADELERIVAIIADALPDYGIPASSAGAVARGIMLLLSRAEVLK